MDSSKKAKELVEEFSQYSDCENGKYCALICVDEILLSDPTEPSTNSFNWDESNEEALMYWKKVKQEILKL